MSSLRHRRQGLITSPAVIRRLWEDLAVLPGVGGAARMMGSLIAIPGSQDYTTPGTYAFIVPVYNTLTVTVDGAGGGGAGELSAAVAGGNSSFNGTVIAGGGGAGSTAAAGASSAASGGDSNLGGAPGQIIFSGGNGGSAASGASGGTGSGNNNTSAQPGGFPGGGGGACTYGVTNGGGGGGGARAVKTYTIGQLAPGSSITVIVGQGGARGNSAANSGNWANGNGGTGRVQISWS